MIRTHSHRTNTLLVVKIIFCLCSNFRTGAAVLKTPTPPQLQLSIAYKTMKKGLTSKINYLSKTFIERFFFVKCCP